MWAIKAVYIENSRYEWIELVFPNICLYLNNFKQLSNHYSYNDFFVNWFSNSSYVVSDKM